MIITITYLTAVILSNGLIPWAGGYQFGTVLADVLIAYYIFSSGKTGKDPKCLYKSQVSKTSDEDPRE